MQSPVKTAWKPLPGSQSLAVSCPCSEILYHGTRGPGKTAAQIAFFLAKVGKGYGSYWRGVIFGRTYKNLNDAIAQSQRMIPLAFPGARWLSANDKLCWEFPGGESLLFRHIKRPSEYDDNYHGHEYPFIGFNELSKYPTRELYDLMLSCNRSGFDPAIHSPDPDNPLPDIPLVVFSTTNPHGSGHNWIKRDWIDRAPPGVPFEEKATVYDPRIQAEREVSRSKVHIFGSYKENPYLPAAYVATLQAIVDPNKRRAWLGGDWNATGGGMLEEFWVPSTHVLPRFPVPKAWKLVRSFDWGSSHPFSVGFWAIANGEEVKLPDGTSFCPVKGSLVRVGDLYGVVTTKDGMGRTVPAYGTNKGLGLEAREVARRVLEEERKMKAEGWTTGAFRPGPADNQIYNVNEKESGSIAKLMESEGVAWIRSDKSPGSRKNGLELIKCGLMNARTGEGPGIYVMQNCGAFLATVPGLPRDEKDPDDWDTTAEDHVADEVRYMVLSDKPTWAGSLKVTLG